MKYQMFVLAHHNVWSHRLDWRCSIPLKIQSRCLIYRIRTEVIHTYVLLYIQRRKKIMCLGNRRMWKDRAGETVDFSNRCIIKMPVH